MKKLVVLLFVLLVCITSSFSQTLIIEVFESQTYFKLYNTSIDNVLSSPDEIETKRNGNGKYILNFKTRILEYYKDGSLLFETEFDEIPNNDGVIEVRFNDNGFDVGLRIIRNFGNDQVVWFNLLFSGSIEVDKFTKFKIIDPM